MESSYFLFLYTKLKIRQTMAKIIPAPAKKTKITVTGIAMATNSLVGTPS